ncbi:MULTISPECIES: hypothetical protein [Pantoea]|uniref:hypothetical protein n=1 Tax=Pantoea TaxID=53335 RepID=UPI00197FEA88|nr:MULTISPECIES: hypothetical protein [Pantoea]
MMIFYQLLRPFGYLTIKKVKGKSLYDWIVPLIFSIISLLLISFSHGGIQLAVGDGGLVSKLTGFISNLPGFYIAALAAIATFNRAGIDKLLISNNNSGSSQSPYIVVKDVKSNGIPMKIEVEITRRVFLCLLFSFLTAESIILVIFSFLFSFLLLPAAHYLSFIYLTVFIFVFWQLIVSTFFGLYYLGDRIHYNS